MTSIHSHWNLVLLRANWNTTIFNYVDTTRAERHLLPIGTSDPARGLGNRFRPSGASVASCELNWRLPAIVWRKSQPDGNPVAHPRGSGIVSQPPARKRGVASLVLDRARLRASLWSKAATERTLPCPPRCVRSRAKAEGRIRGPSECLGDRWTDLEKLL